MLLDLQRPSRMIYTECSRAVCLTIPRQALEARIGPAQSLTVLPMDASRPLAALAAGFVSLLPSRIGRLDATAGAKLTDQALDLVALAYSVEAAGTGVVLSSPRATTLFRLKSVIEARLCDPDLKPAAVAAAAGISIRYANDLLAQEDFSVERYILHRRLERCRRALEDPAQRHRTIGEIAFAWGFGDLSHFARRFRAAYGCTPGDCRRCGLDSGRSACEVAGDKPLDATTPK